MVEGSFDSSDTKLIRYPEGYNPKDMEDFGGEMEYEPRLNPRYGGKEGPSYSRMLPILGFRVGKDIYGNTCLSVPTTDYINAVVDEKNPGGFRSTPVNGFVNGHFLLTEQSLGNIVLSGDFNKKILFTVPTMGFYDPRSKKEFRGSYAAHDYVDHLAAVAVDPHTKDVFATMARLGLTIPWDEQGVSSMIANQSDYSLMLLSEYGITPVAQPTPREKEHREKLWANLSNRMAALHGALGAIKFGTEDERIAGRMSSADEQREVKEAIAQDQAFRIDREQLDDNLRRMQSYHADDFSSTKHAPVMFSLAA
jgi:hypothetical protein